MPRPLPPRLLIVAALVLAGCPATGVAPPEGATPGPRPSVRPSPGTRPPETGPGSPRPVFTTYPSPRASAGGGGAGLPAARPGAAAIAWPAIAAGAPDLGAGRPATQVDLPQIVDILPAPDGGLWVAAQEHRRVWKLTADGKLETAVGSGHPKAGSLDGVKGPDAGLINRFEVLLDAGGRLVIAELAYPDPELDVVEPRVSRLEADGTLRAIACPGVPLAPIGGETLLAMFGDRTLAAVAPGQAPRVLRELADGEREELGERRGHAFAGGKGWLLTSRYDDKPRFTLFEIDPATGAMTARFRESDAPAGVGSADLDAAGNLHWTRLLGKRGNGVQRLALERRSPAGQVTTLVDELPEFYVPARHAVAPSGKTWVLEHAKVYELRDGALERVVGRGSERPPFGAAGREAASLRGDFRGLAALPDGRLVSPDGGDVALVVLDGDGMARAIEPERPYTRFGVVRADAAGGLLLIDNNEDLLRMAPDGRLTTIYDATHSALAEHTKEPATQVLDAVPAGAGRAVVLLGRWVWKDGEARPGTRYELWEVAAGAQQGTAIDAGNLNQGSYWRLAADPAGTAYVIDGADETAYRVKGAALETLGRLEGLNGGTEFAADARGRLYVGASKPHRILRWDPATGKTETIAGPGGRAFAGTHVDDSVRRPRHLTLTPQGDLAFVDEGRRQIKVIPAARLGPP